MEPQINISAMEEQIRRAALALLPAEANATWTRAGSGELNALGEPEEPEELSWDVRVFFVNYRLKSSRWTPDGIKLAGAQKVLCAGPDGWSPKGGDRLVKDGGEYRVMDMLRMDVDGDHYWELAVEKI